MSPVGRVEWLVSLGVKSHNTCYQLAPREVNNLSVLKYPPFIAPQLVGSLSTGSTFLTRRHHLYIKSLFPNALIEIQERATDHPNRRYKRVNP